MMSLKVPGLSVPISADQIIWLQGEGNYSWIYVAGHRRLLVCQTLLWFESRLRYFVRVHQGALVNPTYISLVEQRSSRWAQLHLDNGTRVAISRRRIAFVVDQLALIEWPNSFARL